MNEQSIEVAFEGGSIPCSLYVSPNPGGIALLGHGLGVDRFDETVVRPATALFEAGFSVVVPELPLHGARSEGTHEWSEIVSEWQGFWASEGRNVLLAEWRAVLSYTRRTFELPVVYFGLSLGTQYGILLLSQVQEVRAAVLGLFGSEPPPKSRVLNMTAPKVSIPVYFIQKLNDEIHPAETNRHLYDSLGAARKVLDASAGLHLHGEVSRRSIQEACRFLAEQVEG